MMTYGCMQHLSLPTSASPVNMCPLHVPAVASGQSHSRLNCRTPHPPPQCAAHQQGAACSIAPVPSMSSKTARRGQLLRLQSVNSTSVHITLPEKEIITPLDQKKIQTLNERFKRADKDGSGRIDREELRALLESFEAGDSYLLTQHWLPEQELDRVLATYDKDGSGTITLEGFQQLIRDGILLDGALHEYEEAFKAVDRSGNGSIGATELAVLFQSIGQPMSMEKLVELMQKYDIDESGQIEFNEFLLMFRDNLLGLRDIELYMQLAPKPGPGTRGSVVDAVDGGMTLIFSETELDEILTANPDRVVVVCAALTWCRPCKAMQRPVAKLAEAYKDIIFVKLFGNSNARTKALFKERLQVRSTPCYIGLRQGKVVFTQTGANKEKLETGLRALLPPEKLPVTALFPAEPSIDSVDSADPGGLVAAAKAAAATATAVAAAAGVS